MMLIILIGGVLGLIVVGAVIWSLYTTGRKDS